MKHIISFFLSFLIVVFCVAQAGKKPVQKEKPPTQKEMDAMMKDMQKAMGEMSEEDKKMMDSMGIKMPDMKAIQKSVSGISDAQLEKAWEDEMRIVPKRDAVRIANIPPTPGTAALPGFITQVHSAVLVKLSSDEKSFSEKAYQLVKSNPGTNTGNAAVGLWLARLPVPALYLMGKSCSDNPENVDNLNNYAVMLSMMGAEQAALPILQNLNKRFPQNSTILNNIGQAWFGLGEIQKAEKYLDSAIRLFPYHSQANLTISKIEESKGNTKAAAEAIVRAMHTAYNSEKESRLRKLGGKPDDKNLPWPFPMPQDPLALHRFTWPAYPKSVAESLVLEKEWDDFKKMCREEIGKLEASKQQLEEKAQQENEARIKQFIGDGQNLNGSNILPPFAALASKKLNYLISDKDGGMAYRLEKIGKDMADLLKEDADLIVRERTEKEQVHKKYDPLIGEGRPNPLEQYCAEINKISDNYLKVSNPKMEQANSEYLELVRKRTNDLIYYSQYTLWPADFEVAKVDAKISWLSTISGQVVHFRENGPFCKDSPEEEKEEEKELAEFDDIACQYNSKTDLGLIEFTSNCSRLEGKLKLGPLEYERKVDMDKDILLAASMQVVVGAKAGWEKGPVQAELKAAITGKIEWDEHRVTNWVVTSEVGASAGSNLGYGDKSIDIAGVEARISMDGSSSVAGKGVLKGLNISNKK